MIKSPELTKKEAKLKEGFLLTRVRIVRNFIDFPFTDNLNLEKRMMIENKIINLAGTLKDNSVVYESQNMTDDEKQYFIESSYEAGDFFSKKNARFIYLEKSKIAIIMNNNEHVKLVNLRNDMLLKDQYKEISKMEEKIGNVMPYAASSRYGFLTQEIKNCGLGLKLSVLVHLPGIFLQNRHKETFEDLAKKGYLVEKWFNEKETTYFYIISSKLNFGVNEDNLIERFTSGLKSLLAMEKETLMDYYNNNKDELDDIIFRSLGLLKYARKIDQDEALSNISNLLTGSEIDINLGFDPRIMNVLVREVLDGNVAMAAGKEKINKLTARSNIIKKHLNSGDNDVQ